jgi:division protein CdvB (Snf7/Vps24/ESCRT-III family)
MKSKHICVYLYFHSSLAAAGTRKTHTVAQKKGQKARKKYAKYSKIVIRLKQTGRMD